MAENELRIIRLKDDFYRDGFYKIVTALLMMLAAILLLVAISFYLISQRPAPVVFPTDNEWRAFPPIPVDQAYIPQADLIQWVSNVIPLSFTFDFLHYKNQLDALPQYFTTNGWAKLTGLLNTYANSKVIENGRLYVQGTPAGAPFILNKGLISGKYGWWVQMPLDILSTGVGKNSTQPLVLQALVIRVSTLNDLSGVAIDDLVIPKSGGQNRTNG